MTQGPLSAAQCRGARAILGWMQEELADAAGVSRQTVAEFERGQRATHANNLKALRAALEASGVTFLGPEDGQEGVIFPTKDSRRAE